MNVIDTVIKSDYCIGCGVCAGICPFNNLHMEWSNQGELIPCSNDSCNYNCSICLDICPFYDHNVNQDDIANNLFYEIPDISYNEYTGYYTNCYVGYNKNDRKRLKSASGGVATSFLSILLMEKIVDKVVAVGIFENPKRMFEFKILNTFEEVNSCAGSAYYPVEISGVLKKILEDKSEDKYAVIALPCVVYALRLVMKKVPKLKKKIKLIASLACGQLQNRFCTEFLALESGIPVEKLSKMDFRRKSKDTYASDFSQVAIDENREEGVPKPYSGLPIHLWNYQYFKQNACNFCDDIFGELADVTFMDAWLPEYVNDYRGTSLIITRIPFIEKVLKNSEELCLKNINVKQVLESQGGCIQKKRTLIRGKLYKMEKLNKWYPKKRVEPDINIYIKNKQFIDLTNQIQSLSKELWPKYRLSGSTEGFWEDCKELELQINKYERKLKLRYFIKLPASLFMRFLEVSKNGNR